MPTHFKANDPDGILITCDRENWSGHIADKHPEMDGQEAAVIAAIESPLAIYSDVAHKDRRVFYSPGLLPHPFNRAYVRVVVEYRQTRAGRRGYVVTAFAAYQPKQGESILWP